MATPNFHRPTHIVSSPPTLSLNSAEAHLPTLVLPSPAISPDPSPPISLPRELSSSATCEHIQHSCHVAPHDPILPLPVTDPTRYSSTNYNPTPCPLFAPLFSPASAARAQTESILESFERSERGDLPNGFPYTDRAGLLSFAWEFLGGLQGLVMEHLEGQGGNGRWGEVRKTT